MFYPHFYPAYRAGGITRSLSNLTRLMQPEVRCLVVTSDHDLGERQPLDGIASDEWVSWSPNLSVWYARRGRFSAGLLNRIWQEFQPATVYLNGLYLPRFALLPYLFFRNKPVRIVWAPRGMLQRGAVQIRHARKRVFLQVLKGLGVHRRVVWHATDQQEAKDIASYFGPDVSIQVAPNVPRWFPEAVAPIAKNPGTLHIATWSLIAETKNLLIFIQTFKMIRGQPKIVYDVYGPIKDNAYWQACKKAMVNLPSNIRVNYLGPEPPEKLPTILQQYHLMALPSAGENFGHAIFEALACGRPVLISDQTPWTDLEDHGAGLIWKTSSGLDGLVQKIETAVAWENNCFALFCQNARAYAAAFLEHSNFKDQYLKLFGINKTSKG
ncbi:MAG: glycosyltransferase [Methanobacteriota archaeon]|nr:MAG: glycosyltransferase [Euryarchaeota archaeon]